MECPNSEGGGKDAASAGGDEEIRMRHIGNSRDEMDKGGEMEGKKILWSGDESRHEAGVGFLLGNRARDAIEQEMPS